MDVYKRVKQVPVNVPTRFGSNFFVLRGVKDSQQALIQAVGTEAWADGPGKPPASGRSQSGGELVRDIVERKAVVGQFFWEDVDRLLELLQPFSDAIHQLECDKPMLAQCHVVLAKLHAHVQEFVKKHKGARGGDIVSRLLETFERRYDTTPGSVRAPIYNPAYTAAFLTDPYYAVQADGKWVLPDVPEKQLPAAMELVRRVGGPAAERSLRGLVLNGYPAAMAPWVESVAAEGQPPPPPDANPAPSDGRAGGQSKKRKRAEMPSMDARKKIWAAFGGSMPELRDVVLRLMSCHATACATERNWSLWGRVYSSSRNALGAERAKKLITICQNSRAQSADNDFEVTLKVVEGLADE